MDTSIILAIIAFLAYGVASIFYKVAGAHADGFTITLFASITMTAVAFIAWLFADKTMTLRGISIASLAGVIVGVGFVAFIVGITLGKVSIVSAIRGLSIALTALIAILFLGEKINIYHTAGLVLAVIAIFLLSK